MITRRTRLFAAVATAAGLTLSACGGSDGADPTTKSVEDHAKSEAAKRPTKDAPEQATKAPQSGRSSGSPTSEPGHTASSSTESQSPLPGEVTNTAQATAARVFVEKYIKQLNAAFSKPSSRESLDRFTTAECRSCASLKQTVGTLHRKKQSIKGDLITFQFSTFEVADEPDSYHVYGTFKQEERTIKKSDGKSAGKTDAGEGGERSFEVVRRAGGLKINAIRKAVS